LEELQKMKKAQDIEEVKVSIPDPKGIQVS